jgi:hypothetical protein
LLTPSPGGQVSASYSWHDSSSADPGIGASSTPERRLLWVDVAVKVATVSLLSLAILAPSLPQFQGKAFAGRAIVYPIALVALPIGWWLFGRRRLPFPVASDILLGLPFLIDMLGNALNLYDSIDWWDDLNHLGNWALHTAAIVLIARQLAQTRLVQVLLGIAWAGATAILWELAEYVAFVPDSPEAATAYRDTLGDLALGLLGGTAAAVLIATRSRERT